MTKKVKATKTNEAKEVNGYTGPKLVPTETTAKDAPILTLNSSPELTRAITVLASAILFAAPAFATQANPNNIVALADMFSKYASGSIQVTPPEQNATTPSPTFG